MVAYSKKKSLKKRAKFHVDAWWGKSKGKINAETESRAKKLRLCPPPLSLEGSAMDPKFIAAITTPAFWKPMRVTISTETHS